MRSSLLVASVCLAILALRWFLPPPIHRAHPFIIDIALPHAPPRTIATVRPRARKGTSPRNSPLLSSLPRYDLPKLGCGSS